MKPISLAVVGAGTAFWDLHFPVLAGRSDVAITHVVSRTPEAGADASDRIESHGLARPTPCLLGDGVVDVDAVLVTVPIAHTSREARRWIEAGIHVFAEKPISEAVAAGEELMALASAKGVALLAGENFRLQPDFARLRELAESGVVGVPKVYFLNDLHFTSIEGVYARTAWRQSGEHSGGYLIDGGTHIVAGMREMTGRKVVSVHALATATQDYLSQQDDTLLINLQFEGGLVGHLTLGYGLYDHEARHPKILGTEATLCLARDGILLIDGDGPRVLEERSGESGFSAEWEVFIEAVASGDTTNVARLTAESIEDLRVLEAALQSAASGDVVKL